MKGSTPGISYERWPSVEPDGGSDPVIIVCELAASLAQDLIEIRRIENVEGRVAG
jgi:hypothetical protein